MIDAQRSGLTDAQAKLLIARAQARQPRGGWMLAAVQDAYATGRFMGGMPRGVSQEPVIPQPVRDFDTPEAYAMRAAFDAPPAALYFRPPTWRHLWWGLWQSLYKTPTGAYWLGVSVATVGWTTFFLLFR